MAEEYLPREHGSLSMRQTFRYTGDDAHRLAVRRTREYLDDERWGIFMHALRTGAPFRKIRFMFMIVGVEGYPVNAMIREYHLRYVRRFGAPSERRPKLRIVA